MKKILLLASMLIFTISVSAVPAKRVWRTFSQPDGTKVELMLVGDENFHYFLTRDDVPVVEDKDAYYYAKAMGFAVSSSGVLAHESSLRTAEEQQHMSTIEDILSVRQFALKKGPKQAPPMRVGEEEHASYVGHKKGLIILANFSDKKFFDYKESNQGLDTWNRYDRLANEVGYTNEFGAIGSVHDYYYNQSYGKLDLTFDVVGPIELERPFSFYGQGKDGNAPLMIVESCIAVDDLVDFNDYDWDGDGIVEEVFVLYAGYGEATGGPTNTVWPHMWTIESAAYYTPDLGLTYPFILDGAEVNVYACSNELYSSYGTTQMGLGVFCHEFSHCLGLPDFYDTSYGGNFGLDAWDVLDSGSYNGPSGLGWVPAGYSCYERWYAGWMKPSILKSGRRITNQKPLNEHGQAYIIYNDNHEDEYYIIENRNQTEWDSYLPGSGLLIFHVDYDPDQWMANSVNTNDNYLDHERMTVFHASNSNRGGHEAYPYQGNDSLTDNSVPAAKLWNENKDGSKLMHKPITEIKRDEVSGKTSFLFRNKNNVDEVDEMFIEEGDNMVSVYRLDGIKVSERMSPADVYSLPKGTYMLRGKDGTSKKVHVD